MAWFPKVLIKDLAGKVAGITDPDGDGIGGLDVYIQDQHTGIVDLFLMNVEGTFTLASTVTIDTNTFTATGGHGITTGDTVFLSEGIRFSQFTVLNVVTDTITVDSPIDVAYTTGATCQRGITNMNVDGSSTPVIFSIAPLDISPTSNQWDIVRMIFAIQDGSSMDSSMFGSIAGGITNGVVIRQKDGLFQNYFNIKTNGDFALRAYDISFDDRASPQGEYFFRSRRTFGGASKTGVTIRLAGEDNDEFQVIIQDDLTSLDSFSVTVQGHVVE
jgi:hypothetical protein